MPQADFVELEILTCRHLERVWLFEDIAKETIAVSSHGLPPRTFATVVLEILLCPADVFLEGFNERSLGADSPSSALFNQLSEFDDRLRIKKFVSKVPVLKCRWRVSQCQSCAVLYLRVDETAKDLLTPLSDGSHSVAIALDRAPGKHRWPRSTPRPSRRMPNDIGRTTHTCGVSPWLAWACSFTGHERGRANP